MGNTEASNRLKGGDNHSKPFVQISVKALHQLIWEKPLSAISKDWDINSQAITKACDKHSVPRPLSGHWTLVSLGKAPNVASLPEDIDGSLIINFRKRQKPRINKPTIDLSPSKTMSTKRKVTVPNRIGKFHPLSQLAKQHYKKPTFEYDKLMVSPWQIETYQFTVSPEKFDRALKIFDSLLKYFNKQGWPFKITDNFTRRSKINAVVIYGKTVTFKLREKTKQTPRNLNTKEQQDKAAGRYVYYEKVLMPTGMFHLTIEEYVDGNCKTAFIDKPGEPIEDKLDEFIASLVATSEYMEQRKIERAKEEQERLKQQKLNDFFNKEVKKEKDNIAFLFEQFENWQKAEKARQFVAAIKHRIQDSGEITKDQEKWLLWAEHILTLEDPIAKAIELSSVPKIEDELTESIDAKAINTYFKRCIEHRPTTLDKTVLNNAKIVRMNKKELSI
jgi:hypothetical protein